MLKIRQVNEQQINAALQAVQNEQDKIDNKMNDMSKKFSKSLLELDDAVGDNLGYLNDNFVPNTRKINGHELTDDITLTASDVGAATTGDIGNAISALDVSSVGGSGKYISEISESDGLIIGTASNLSDASVGSAGKWTTARDIKIQDADGTNTGAAVSVDGSGNATLKLPSTIKATLSGNASSATTTSRLGSIAIANIRIGSAQARISLSQLMTWLITTKAYIPSGTDCYKVLGVPWDYSGNDILQFSANGASFELQLAGCLIEFMGNATNYNTGRFRLRIHSSPTTSFTVTSGYIKFPVSRIAEYTCNGSGYTPTWKVVGTDEKYANSFWGMTDPDGADNVWIRSTSQGLLPYQSGGAGSGHNYLGTSSWYWKYAYIDQIYGYLNGSISGSAGSVSTTWLLNKIYPVGSVYMSVSSTNPGTFLGGTWKEITDGRFLRARGGQAASVPTIAQIKAGTGIQAEGLPNITGYIQSDGYSIGSNTSITNSGAMKGENFNKKTSSGTSQAASYMSKISFDASLGNSTVPDGASSGKIYGNSSHVTPKNMSVYMWVRTE